MYKYMYFNKLLSLPTETTHPAIARMISGSDMNCIFLSWNYEIGTAIILIWGFS